MAEFIAESPRLIRLDLRENEIKTGGLMALSLALKVNTSLLRLDLDREPKKETVSNETRKTTFIMSNLVSLIDFSLSAHSEMNKMYEENLEIFI